MQVRSKVYTKTNVQAHQATGVTSPLDKCCRLQSFSNSLFFLPLTVLRLGLVLLVISARLLSWGDLLGNAVLMAPAKRDGKARQRRPKTVGVAIGDGNVDTEFCVSSAAAGDARNIANGSSRKRKSSDGPTNGDAASSEPSEAHKKARLVTEHPSQKCFEPTRRTGADKSLLPPEVWHCIFKFCPPTTLGNLLRVNKLFNRYLDPSSRVLKPFPSVKHKGAVDALNPDVIWRESRKLFWPYMPSPLRSLSELEMWRLVCSSSCQNCGKHADRETVAQKKPHDPYHSGPGPNGVAVIWQFAVILCGSCLLEKTTKVGLSFALQTLFTLFDF